MEQFSEIKSLSPLLQIKANPLATVKRSSDIKISLLVDLFLFNLPGLLLLLDVS